MFKRTLPAVFTIGLALCAFGAAEAAPAKKTKPKSCWDTAQTTYDMTMCGASEGKAADAELNRVYQRLMKDLTPEQKASLIAAERAWIAFRKADCAFVGSEDGSIASVDAATCWTDRTIERTKQLKDWPPNHGPDE